VPLAPNKLKIYTQSLQSIFRLDWAEPMPIVFGREDNPLTEHYFNLTDKHNQVRQMVLDGGFDALLLVESDMIIPPDALQRLVSLPFDVSYGLYCERHKLHRWLAFFYIDEWAGVSYSQDNERAKAAWGNACETNGVGLGCTLIWRNVLEQIEFRSHPESKVADDWLFALDVKKAGFTQGHDFGVKCGHITRTGDIIWPDITADGFYKVEFNHPVETEITTEKPLRLVTSVLGTQTVYGRRKQKVVTANAYIAENGHNYKPGDVIQAGKMYDEADHYAQNGSILLEYV